MRIWVARQVLRAYVVQGPHPIAEAQEPCSSGLGHVIWAEKKVDTCDPLWSFEGSLSAAMHACRDVPTDIEIQQGTYINMLARSLRLDCSVIFMQSLHRQSMCD